MLRKLFPFAAIAAATYILSKPEIRNKTAAKARQISFGALPSPTGPAGQVDDPSDLSKATWRRALMLTGKAIKDKDLTSSAAALSYYTTLSFFPALIGLASLYVVVAGQHGLLNLISQMHGVLPESLYTVIQRQLTPIATTANSKAGVALVISVIALLWTTSGGFQNLVKATDKAYEVEETRKFIKLRLVSLALSLALIVVGIAMLALLLMQSSALRHLGAPTILANLFPILRWPVLAVLISFSLALIYRYAPNRQEPHWQWVSWGAVAAAVIWLLATAGFFVYVQHFGNYTKTYGTFAAIIVLMVWFNISSLIILLGAQVNKKLETVSGVSTTD